MFVAASSRIRVCVIPAVPETDTGGTRGADVVSHYSSTVDICVCIASKIGFRFCTIQSCLFGTPVIPCSLRLPQTALISFNSILDLSFGFMREWRRTWLGLSKCHTTESLSALPTAGHSECTPFGRAHLVGRCILQTRCSSCCGVRWATLTSAIRRAIGTHPVAQNFVEVVPLFRGAGELVPRTDVRCRFSQPSLTCRQYKSHEGKSFYG